MSPTEDQNEAHTRG